MAEYTQDMFDVTKIEETHNILFMQKETLEFQIKIYQEKFDMFRKKKYKDLLIFERKKEFEKTLLPDTIVLRQMNLLESDPSVREFRQTLVRLKRELKNINTRISNETKKLNNMFTFKEVDLFRYVDKLNEYFDMKLTFDELMKDIFNKEFRNQDMYYEIKEQRNYDIVKLLVYRSSVEWKSFMNVLIAETKYIYTIEDMKTTGDDFESFIQDEEQRRNVRVAKTKTQLALVESIKNKSLTERKEMSSRVIHDPREIAREFIRSREERHQSILSQAYAARPFADRTMEAGAYIRDPANSATGQSADWTYTKWTPQSEMGKNVDREK